MCVPGGRDLTYASVGGLVHEAPRHLLRTGKHNKVYSHLLACAAVDETVRALAAKMTSWDVEGILTGQAPVPLDDCMPWYQAWKAAVGSSLVVAMLERSSFGAHICLTENLRLTTVAGDAPLLDDCRGQGVLEDRS